METCARCRGYGSDDGICYHCEGTGKVDSYVARNDQLFAVAHSLASTWLHEYRHSRDHNYDEEDFAFCAAENMLSVPDYCDMLFWDKQDQILQELEHMSTDDQNLLIAWNNQ